MSYTEENDKVFEYYLENTFYKGWRHEDPERYSNYKHLELMVYSTCPLKCKYCYIHKYGDSLLPVGSRNRSKILDNTDKVIEWLYTNGFTPFLEIFAGDSLADPTCRKIIHKMLDSALSGRVVCTDIVLPTNMSWIDHRKQYEDVLVIMEKAEAAKVGLHISASIDGKYMEENRPYKSDKERYTDRFYHELFSFASRHNVGFHPMVYSNNIEKWIDNFNWFQSKFKEYGIPWRNLYLLEVRNEEWTETQARHFGDLIQYLVYWLWDNSGRNKDRFTEMFKQCRGFNTLISGLSKIGRGLGCSLQSSICIRIGDLTIVPCHRTAYSGMEAATMKEEDGRIIGFDSKNVELFLATHSCSPKMFPYCEACSIQSVCSGGCLGAQYESTGDLFTPIPSVCRLFHYKIHAMAQAYKNIGALDLFTSLVNTDEQIAAIQYILGSKIKGD